MNKEDQLQILAAVIGSISFYYWQHSIAGTISFASVLVLLYAKNGSAK